MSWGFTVFLDNPSLWSLIFSDLHQSHFQQNNPYNMMLPPPMLHRMVFFRLRALPFFLSIYSADHYGQFNCCILQTQNTPADFGLTCLTVGASSMQDSLLGQWWCSALSGGWTYFSTRFLQLLHQFFCCCLGIQLNPSDQSSFVTGSQFAPISWMPPASVCSQDLGVCLFIQTLMIPSVLLFSSCVLFKEMVNLVYVNFWPTGFLMSME